MVESEVPPKTIEARHELGDLSPRNIAIFALSLAVTIVIVLGVSYELFQHYSTVITKAETAPSPLSYSREPVPEPHLLVIPGRDMKTMRAAEDLILNHYAWVDKEKGIVRIPISRAIELLAQRGLPTRLRSNETPAGSQKPSSERNRR